MLKFIKPCSIFLYIDIIILENYSDLSLFDIKFNISLPCITQFCVFNVHIVHSYMCA